MITKFMLRLGACLTVVCLLNPVVSAQQPIEQWVARYDGPANGWDYAKALAIDADGNVYVTGYSDGVGTMRDYATIKYDSTGNELWVARYDGPANRWDHAEALAIDANGNVYVTGYSDGDGTSYDYATIKYDSYGNELWVARYNGLANSQDFVVALAVDTDGNVYVTGYSDGVGTMRDYATIKYDSSGNELWVARYDGPANWWDHAEALAIDADGNVYVTGYSDGVGTSYDYATIKYDSSGNELWVARYDGPANRWEYAEALAIDADGNVYVTGYSEGDGTRSDYATIKYDSYGNELWVARYSADALLDNALALAVDKKGNVYVTGRSEGDFGNNYYDYATIKYDSFGNELWVARYYESGFSRNTANALAVDGDGNVYVTGYSDGDGTSYDYATIKYDSFGNELWVARYNGPGYLEDVASAVAVDENGNVYVTGRSEDVGTDRDFATIKYVFDSDGDGILDSDDICPEENAAGFDIDKDGCIDSLSGLIGLISSMVDTGVVEDQIAKALISLIGSAELSTSNGNISAAINQLEALNNKIEAQRSKKILDEAADLLIEYTDILITQLYDELPFTAQLLNEEWVARYNGPGNWGDEAYAVVVDEDGNVYVTGMSYGSGTDWDYATIKYDASGNELWVTRYNGPNSSDDIARALTVDTDGNVYVTGDVTTIKYDASGNEQWVAQGPNWGASSLAVDKRGNVYVTGGSNGDFATIKYDSSGNEQWMALYNGPGNYYDFAAAIAVDDVGNVYVTGGSYDTGASEDDLDYTTIKYDSSGNELWVARYNGPSDAYDFATGLAVDRKGNVYVTGESTDGAIIIKYDPSGNELWAVRYNGPGDFDAGANSLALDKKGNVYVTAESNGDYTTIKYDSSGNEQWMALYDGPDHYLDVVTALAVDAEGNFYITGRSQSIDTGSDYMTIKYSSIDVTDDLDADIDQDGDADALDLSRILEVYGLDENDTNFDPLCDLVSDGIIDEKDVEAWVPFFGITDCPCQM